MSRRVVMRLSKWSQDIETVEKFFAQAKELGAGPRARMNYAVAADGTPCFYIELPEKAAEALEKRQRPKQPTKAQQAVKEQLEARQNAVRAGKPVPGHVAPVAQNGKVIRLRKKKR